MTESYKLQQEGKKCHIMPVQFAVMSGNSELSFLLCIIEFFFTHEGKIKENLLIAFLS